MASQEADEDADEDSMPIGGSQKRPSMTGDRLFEMDVIGWLIFVLLLIVIIPLLPILVVIVALSRVVGWEPRRPVSWT